MISSPFIYSNLYLLKYIVFAVILCVTPFVALIALKIIQKFSAGRCKSLVCLNGKTVIVTGGFSGIGLQTALVLASRGARIILADRGDGEKAKGKIIDKTGNTNIVTKHIDFASLDTVRKFAKDINETEKRLDILINNAGVGSIGHKYTDDGLHATMQINHFGPFLLTHLLTDLLKKSAPSKIIWVSSAAAFLSNLTIDNLNYPKESPNNLYRAAMIYCNSKLCNIIAANGFADRLKDAGVTSNSLHPGMVNSSIYMKFAQFTGIRDVFMLLQNIVLYAYGKSTDEGAQTAIHLALSNKLRDVTGKHFWDCRMFPMPPGAWNDKFVDEIWQKSEELVGIVPVEKAKDE